VFPFYPQLLYPVLDRPILVPYLDQILTILRYYSGDEDMVVQMVANVLSLHLVVHDEIVAINAEVCNNVIDGEAEHT
jgi:hypothetical protein